jgi:hypothetical protein
MKKTGALRADDEAFVIEFMSLSYLVAEKRWYCLALP